MHTTQPLHRVVDMFNDVAAGDAVVTARRWLCSLQSAMAYIQVKPMRYLYGDRVEVHALYCPARSARQMQKIAAAAAHVEQMRTGAGRASRQVAHLVDEKGSQGPHHWNPPAPPP